MAKRGRKPLPTALKIASGVSPYRINGQEPAAKIAIPEKPETVGEDPVASKKWDELAPLLVERSVLADWDGTALEMLCVSYSEWRKDRSDFKLGTQLRRMLCEFGLTPSSRSTIKVSGEKPKDELQEFLAKTKRQA